MDCCGVDEAGDVAGGEGAGAQRGGAGEEAAASLIVLVEDMLRSDLGGADDGFKAAGFSEEHDGSLPAGFIAYRCMTKPVVL